MDLSQADRPRNDAWPIIIGGIIMIGRPFRWETNAAYTNRLACLLVINNAKGVHKAVSRATPLRLKQEEKRKRWRENRNLPIGE